jgi:hypothetical protein
MPKELVMAMRSDIDVPDQNKEMPTLQRAKERKKKRDQDGPRERVVARS